MKIELNRPPIRPRFIADETPIGYLKRVSEANGYESFRWLLPDEYRRASLDSHSLVLETITANEWCMPIERIATAFTTQICSLAPVELNQGFLRYCPKCLENNKYWRMSWQLKGAVCCELHKLWLVDRCPKCGSALRMSNTQVCLCKCGGKLLNTPVEYCSREILDLTEFLNRGAVRNGQLAWWQSCELQIEDRVRLIRFYSRYQEHSQALTTGTDTNLKLISTAGDVLSDASRVLLSDKRDFTDFLKTLAGDVASQRLGVSSAFTNFYKAFFHQFAGDSFVRLRGEVESFAVREWQQPVTKRHSLFCDRRLDKQPWIPLCRVVREYKVSLASLILACTSGDVQVRETRKKKRTTRWIQRKSLEDWISHENDLITAIEGREILGVTKRQFSDLVVSGLVVPVATARKGGGQNWSRSQILSLVERCRNKCETQEFPDQLQLSDALRVVGARIRRPISQILKAVLSGELTAKYGYSCSKGLSAIIFDRRLFREWVKTRRRVEGFTIPMVAKKLRINQEFTYQLVNCGLIDSQESEFGTKIITKSNLRRFRAKYLILSKLTKRTKSTSAKLAYLLEMKGYRRVEVSRGKLRQVVYRRNLQ